MGQSSGRGSLLPYEVRKHRSTEDVGKGKGIADEEICTEEESGSVGRCGQVAEDGSGMQRGSQEDKVEKVNSNDTGPTIHTSLKAQHTRLSTHKVIV